MQTAEPEPNVTLPAAVGLPLPGDDPLDLSEEFSEEEALSDEPATRLRQLGRLRSGYTWEYVRQSLHPLLLARVPLVEIAERFNVSAHTVYRWRDRLHEDMRREAVTMQPRDFIMESLTSLREVRAEAWQAYQTAETPKQRLTFLDLIVKAESSLLKLGHTIGLYGNRGDRPLHPATYNEPLSPDVGSEVLNELLRSFLASRPGIMREDGQAQEANPEP